MLNSCVKAIWQSSYTSFSVLGDWDDFGKLGPDKVKESHWRCQHFTPNEALLKSKGHLFVLVYLGTWGNLRKLELNATNHWEGYAKKDPMCSTPQIVKAISELTYTWFSVVRKLAQVTDTQKAIQKKKKKKKGPFSWMRFNCLRLEPLRRGSLLFTTKFPKIQNVKLNLSHQMKPNSSVKAIWRSRYTCVSVFKTSWWVGEIGPKYIPKIMKEKHRNFCKVFNSTFHIKWSLIQW